MHNVIYFYSSKIGSYVHGYILGLIVSIML